MNTRTWRGTALVAICLLCAAAGSAHGVDRLSGEYLPAGADPAQLPPDASLKVVAQDGGWLARFRGEDKRLQPASTDEMVGLFPGVGESRQLQCGMSAEFILCRVLPGTYFPQQGFRIDSGYFSVIAGSGLYELERVTADDGEH